MGVSLSDGIERLQKAWHLNHKPGVWTASLFTGLSIEAVLVTWWPGLADFVLAQLGIMVLVVVAVAFVDAGRLWDGPLFDAFYRPEDSTLDGRPLPDGRLITRERPYAGLLPDGVALTRRRNAAAALLPLDDGLYRAARTHVAASVDGDRLMPLIDGPLELSKGLRALLAPLAALFVVGSIGAVIAAASSGETRTWLAISGLALLLWVVFAYVHIQRRYEHLVRLYTTVASGHRTV